MLVATIEQDLDLDTLYKTRPRRFETPYGILQCKMEAVIYP